MKNTKEDMAWTISSILDECLESKVVHRDDIIGHIVGRHVLDATEDQIEKLIEFYDSIRMAKPKRTVMDEWDVSSVIRMDGTSFNQDISAWDTSKVMDEWDTSNVINMREACTSQVDYFVVPGFSTATDWEKDPFVVNAKGELVARFENLEECIRFVDAMNGRGS